MGRRKSTRTCDFEGCERKHMAKGLCSVHYWRARTYGDPAAPVGSRFSGTDLERLGYYSALNPATGCVEWTGARNETGYGVTMIAGTRRTILTHRLALRARGIDVAGKVVRHLVCDNPPCINPDHLAVGTHADNVGDKVRKGRQRRAAGDAVQHAIYVEYMIRRPEEPRVAWDLAAKYGVAHTTIREYVRQHRRKYA